MSKSIYEEANLILNGRIADGEVKSFRVTGTTYYKITNALKQAQKQEKLLELYKKLASIRDDLISCCCVIKDDEYDDILEKEIELVKKIKGIEK